MVISGVANAGVSILGSAIDSTVQAIDSSVQASDSSVLDSRDMKGEGDQ